MWNYIAVQGAFLFYLQLPIRTTDLYRGNNYLSKPWKCLRPFWFMLARHISVPRAVTKFCFLAQQWILWTTEAIWANELKNWSQISIFSIPHFCLSTTFYCPVACDCVLPAVIFFTTFLNQNHENTTGSSRFPPHWLLLQNMLLLAGNKFHTKLPIAKNFNRLSKD